jgi:hypothetical protein
VPLLSDARSQLFPETLKRSFYMKIHVSQDFDLAPTAAREKIHQMKDSNIL